MAVIEFQHWKTYRKMSLHVNVRYLTCALAARETASVPWLSEERVAYSFA